MQATTFNDTVRFYELIIEVSRNYNKINILYLV